MSFLDRILSATSNALRSTYASEAARDADTFVADDEGRHIKVGGKFQLISRVNGVARFYTFPDPECVYARHYGGSWNGAGDDQPAIQTALDDIDSRGVRGYVVFPPGIARVNSSVSLHHGTGIRGSHCSIPEYAGSPTGYGTTLSWYGASNGTIIKAFGRDMGVKAMRILVPAGQAADRAIDATALNLNADGICTAHTYEDLLFEGPNLTDGIVVGDLTNTSPTYPYNCENFLYRRVYFSNITNADVRCPNTTGQAKTHRFEHCGFLASAYGIYGDRISFHLISPSFSEVTTTCLYVAHPTDPLYAHGVDLESCARFYSDAGSQGAGVPVSFSGRFDMHGGVLASDGGFIRMGAPGPLILDGCRFAIDDGSNFAILNTTSGPHAVSARGTTFPVVAGGDSQLFRVWGSGAQDTSTIVDAAACLIAGSDGAALRGYSLHQN